MEFHTRTGKVITDGMLDDMAKEYEEGAWQGVGEITPGRPKIYDEDMETVSFRLPKSRIDAIEAVVSKNGLSKSEFFREAIDKALLASA